MMSPGPCRVSSLLPTVHYHQWKRRDATLIYAEMTSWWSNGRHPLYQQEVLVFTSFSKPVFHDFENNETEAGKVGST
jgi:hypothetical protein